MKTDPRTRYTKSIIEQVFMELIHEKPAAKITVSEICAKAEINRGTFYRYYLDVYDLAEKMVDDGVEVVRKKIFGLDGKDFITVFAGVLKMLKEDPRLFRIAMQGSFGFHQENSYISRVFRLCFDHMKEELGQRESQEQVRIFTYISGGSVALIEYWLHPDCTETPEEMAEMISRYARLMIDRA